MLGVRSMVDRLCSVIVGEPATELEGADPELWHYSGPVDLARARREHAAFVELLESLDVDVHVSRRSGGSCDSMFVHDPLLVSGLGAIGLRPGKALRRVEVDPLLELVESLGVPILGRIERGRCEGGDLLWLDDGTLLAGVGFRTSREGVAELQELLAAEAVEVIPFDLPFALGRDACLHLQSLISLVDHDLAVVHLPMLPVRLVELMSVRGIELIEAPADELPTQATNVLCVRPRQVVALRDNPQTKRLLERRGCEVHVYAGDEISLKTEGGPTCLTRPLRRAPA